MTDDLALGIEPRSSNHEVSSGKTNDNEKSAEDDNEKSPNETTKTSHGQHKTAMVNGKNNENPPEGPKVVTPMKSKTSSRSAKPTAPVDSDLPGDAA